MSERSEATTRRRDGDGARRSAPFFVVGAQRSGTTLLRLMLHSHPDLAVPFESDFIPRFHDRLDEYGDLEDRENLERLLADIADNPFVDRGDLLSDPDWFLEQDIRSYPELVDAVFSRYARREDKRRWGDKTPGYVTDLDVLRDLFPACQVIHLVRDGRDVALSLRSVSWGTDHLLRAAEDWRWKTMLGHKMGRMLGEKDYRLVRFEDLVAEPEATLRDVCDFLGEPYSGRMLTYHERASDHLPEGSRSWHTSVLGPPDPSKIFTWKREMADPDRHLFERVAGDALETFGYESGDANPGLVAKLRALRYELRERL